MIIINKHAPVVHYVHILMFAGYVVHYVPPGRVLIFIHIYTMKYQMERFLNKVNQKILHRFLDLLIQKGLPVNHETAGVNVGFKKLENEIKIQAKTNFKP